MTVRLLSIFMQRLRIVPVDSSGGLCPSPVNAIVPASSVSDRRADASLGGLAPT